MVVLISLRLGHGDLIEEEGKAPPFRVELLHIQRSIFYILLVSGGFIGGVNKGTWRGAKTQTRPNTKHLLTLIITIDYR